MSDHEYDYGPFKVGDVVEVFGVPGGFSRFNGCQVTIIGPLQAVRGRQAYEIELPTVKNSAWLSTYCEPGFLRRRRPPATGEQMIRALFDAPLRPQPVSGVA